ncbi:hypothetical protein [Streptomyces albidochromogenes]|uniref:HEAT repeat domain-containing protein n=1 Tax=Streptomyces albidochromogenes TaxID=329524 RepID=A0ABW6FT53_9ACTN
MSRAADQLLHALDPLPHRRRLRHLALAVPRLKERSELGPVLDELDRRGPYERRLAALAALVGRQADFLAARLADPDRVVSGYAMRGARTLPLPDEAVEAAYEGASADTRSRLAALVAADGRTALAERLVERVRGRYGDAEAARLLPACSPAFVAGALPALAHAVESPARLARSHPGLFLDQAERDLAGCPRGATRDHWWQRHAHGTAVVIPACPERVLTLLERHGPGTLPHPVLERLGPLFTADAERTVRWLLSGERDRQRHAPLLPPGALRRLVRADPPSLPALGRLWLHRSQQFTLLLKAMPPHRRGAFVDEVTSGAERRYPGDEVLALLPRERRRAEVRHWGEVAARSQEWSWYDTLETLAYGPFDEAGPELLAALKRPDADDRALAWPLLVACAGRDGGRSAMVRLLDLTGRLRNERDPVRAAALDALAALRPTRFAAEDAEPLHRLLTDSLEARDCSEATRDALRRLAVALLVEHAPEPGANSDGSRSTGGPDPRPALVEWGLRALERITGHVGVHSPGPLHRTLRRGQEHDVFEALRPWLEAAAKRADHRLLFALAEALGPRARRMPGLQRLLEDALRTGDDEAFVTAAALWLDAPGTADERVERLLEHEPSAAVLAPVAEVLARRRTDLLDVLLDDEPPYGRFLRPGADRPLPDARHADRWLPRQQEAAARAAAAVAGDQTRPFDERARALRGAAHLPVHGRRLLLAHLDSPHVVLAEAALGALPWTEQPGRALPVLLDRAGADTARVALYAAARAARFAAPAELAEQLGALLTTTRGAKVTARKEAARLAARFLPTAQGAALLAAAHRAPDSHPDVRAAIVAEAAGLLREPGIWELLDDASHGTPQDQRALAATEPRRVPEDQRARFARLVAAVCGAADREVAAVALRAMPHWAVHAPDTLVALTRAVTDLDARAGWREATGAVAALAVSGLPHPVGGGAAGSLLHDTVAGLLTAERRGEHEALPDRDLPARRRLRALLDTLSWTSGDTPTPVLEAVLAQVGDEPSLAAVRVDLLRRLVDLRADLPVLRARLSGLAAALQGRPVLAAATAKRLEAHVAHAHLPEDCAVVHAAARRSEADDGVPGALLALALVSLMGARLRWPEEWCSLLRVLRRHEDPDVREAALDTTTYYE